MNEEDLIPKFEVGEKAILHFRPYESICSECGQIATFTRQPFTQEVTILKEAKRVRRLSCGCLDRVTGYYTTDAISSRGGKLAVPYTLLEKL